MKRTLALALAIAWHMAVHAADLIPADVAGSWATAASPDAGNMEQSVMYLQADGYGMMAGSTPPAQRMDGVDDGTPGPRAVIGFPVRATLDGATLQLRPFLPRSVPADQAAQAARVVFTCRHDAAGPTLACTVPDGKPFVLHRLGATLPPEAAAMIAVLKAQDANS
jgi:hypothetical protein